MCIHINLLLISFYFYRDDDEYSYTSEFNDIPGESALDLSRKIDDTYDAMADTVVASPVLMPPPVAVPKVNIKNSKICQHPQSHHRENVQLPKKGSTENTNLFAVKQFDKCSVPNRDIFCSVTKNTDIDLYTKQQVKQQISRKIYSN